MIQFLQEEIQSLKPYKHKVLHEATMRDDLDSHHQQLMNIVRSTKQSIALDQLQIEEEHDQLLLLKLQKKKELQEKEKELKMALLEKNRLMRDCELNQLKLQKNRQICKQTQTKNEAAASEKARMIRQIKENEVICERTRMQNQNLRQKCEEQIKIVTAERVNKQCGKAENIIRHNIDQNLSILSKLINSSESLKQNFIKMSKADSKADALRIIELTRQLQHQNAENFMLKGELKCEQIKYFELSSKFQVINKASQIRNAFVSTSDQEQQQLFLQITKEKAKRDELQSKLSQYKRIRKELQQVYGKLSTHYNSCKYSDLHGIKEMNKNSSRLERNISHQKHFLLERYSIVDSYRKYLRNS